MKPSMRDARTIRDAWRAYAERVLPSNASTVQVSETRRGFYTGVLWLFTTLVRDADETPDGIRLLDALDAELRSYEAEIAQEAATLGGAS